MKNVVLLGLYIDPTIKSNLRNLAINKELSMSQLASRFLENGLRNEKERRARVREMLGEAYCDLVI